ncbi:hypothetical protein JW905_05145 [bacterium]|nr:hypothetical protein [candidate division CSSED10-310 bacterium]
MRGKMSAVTAVAGALLVMFNAGAAWAFDLKDITLPEEMMQSLGTSGYVSDNLSLPPSMRYDKHENDWVVERIKAVAGFANDHARNPGAPYIMLAGYYDTDVTYAAGGTFTLIAYVMDMDGYSDIASVEVHYMSAPTGVYLMDDGNSGDFGAGDSVFGLSVTIPPNTLPPDRYLLELVATDMSGNQSDIWPYLTIHP